MDKKIFDILYGFAQKNKHFSRFCDFAAKASSVLFFAVYAGIFLSLMLYRSEKIFLYTVVPFIVLIVNLTIRKLVKRPRPLNASERNSFPSNHSASSGAIAFACMYVDFRLGMVALVLSLITCVLRVFTGRHYITDITCGFLISVVISFLFSIG